MADEAPIPQDEATEPQQQEAPATGEDKPLGEAGERALAQEREARKAAEKDLRALRRELDEIRKSSMSEAEKAVAEAEVRGRTAAAADFGKRLATSEIKAAAATAGADLAGVFDYLDLGRFVAEDGEPDEKAISAFVAGLPKKGTPTPGFDGGARTPTPAPRDMNAVIRQAAGRS